MLMHYQFMVMMVWYSLMLPDDVICALFAGDSDRASASPVFCI